MAGRAFARQTPPLNEDPVLQVYSHFVAEQALTRERVGLEVSPASSPVQMVAPVGTDH